VLPEVFLRIVPHRGHETPHVRAATESPRTLQIQIEGVLTIFGASAKINHRLNPLAAVAPGHDVESGCVSLPELTEF